MRTHRRVFQGMGEVSQISQNAVYLYRIFARHFYIMEVEKMFEFHFSVAGKGKRAAALLAAVGIFFASLPAGAELAASEEKITINLASRILTFWRNGKKVTMYPIAVGAPTTQTPVGDFSVLDKEVDPVWVDPKDMKKKVESGEENPLGYRWMGIGDYYGIHGTNRPDSIGSYVSNGCIRLWEEDAEELYELTEIGTPVAIDYERVVIENLEDGRVAYYIYPDGYHRQSLDVAKVRSALAAFGVADFVSDAEIAEKIEASDGEPTFLPGTLRVEIDNLWISGRAMRRGDKIYLPVASASALTKLPVTSNWDEKTLATEKGTTKGEVFGGKWYFRLEDAPTLFGLSGAVDKDGVLRLYSAVKKAAQTAAQPMATPDLQVKG